MKCSVRKEGTGYRDTVVKWILKQEVHYGSLLTCALSKGLHEKNLHSLTGTCSKFHLLTHVTYDHVSAEIYTAASHLNLWLSLYS